MNIILPQIKTYPTLIVARSSTLREHTFSGRLNGTFPNIGTEDDQNNVLQIMDKFAINDIWIQIDKDAVF